MGYPFQPWEQCLHALTDARLEVLKSWRNFPTEYNQLFRQVGLIGAYGDGFALPVFDQSGQYRRAQVFLPDRSEGWIKRYSEPNGIPVSALTIGALSQAQLIHVLESTWDAFSLAILCQWSPKKNMAFIATRGVSLSKKLVGLLPASAQIIIWPQRDECLEKWRDQPPEKHPSRRWLEAVLKIVGRESCVAWLPEGTKDHNDWLRQGATWKDVQSAIGWAQTIDEATTFSPNGDSPSPRTDDKPQLILPTGPTEYIETAATLFPVLAAQQRYFVRGGAIVEITFKKILTDKRAHDVFQLLEPDSLRSRIEYSFRCCAWREKDNRFKLKEARCSYDAAKVLLKTDEAKKILPHVATLAAAPVLTGERGKLRILYKGFHDVNDGIYVVNDSAAILVPPLKEAVALIVSLLADYEFVTEADRARAVASFISPALHFGKLLDCDYPLDLAEADRSQSGKTYRQKLVSAVYSEQPYIIAKREGGVGSFDESVSTALIAGSPFILIDNYRGHFESQLVESCLRGAGDVNARIPHRGEIQVPVTHINWQLSSNGLDATRDFMNRSIITRICKQPPNFKYQRFPEGDLLAHVRANQAKYLGAIFAVVMEWDRRGRLRSDENGHDFLEWTQTLDWFVQEIFDLEPLVNGHTEEVLRVSDRALTWLRFVALAVEKDKRLDEGLTASEIADICQGHGIEMPGVRTFANLDQCAMYAGSLLGRVFREASEIFIDRYKIRREGREEYLADYRKMRTKFYHWFKKRSNEPK